jgi:hypothetical protein
LGSGIIDTLIVNSGSLQTSDQSNFTRYGGSAGFSLGFFSFGGSAGHSEFTNHQTMQANNVFIKLTFKAVDIDRSLWLDMVPISFRNWIADGFNVGDFSNGQLDPSNNKPFALVPTSFILATHVEISAGWTDSDRTFIHTQTDAGGGFSIGPFSIGGSYYTEQSTTKFRSSWDGQTLTSDGPQIIAWLGYVTPLAPPGLS